MSYLKKMYLEVLRIPRFMLQHLVVALVIVGIFVLLGAGSFFGLLGATLFLLGQEIGQAKHEVPGSVNSPNKWKEIFKYLFSAEISAQWGLMIIVSTFIVTALGLG